MAVFCPAEMLLAKSFGTVYILADFAFHKLLPAGLAEGPAFTIGIVTIVKGTNGR